MSVYRRGDFWHYKFRFGNQIIRESARTKSKPIAVAAERQRRRELELSFNKIPKRETFPLIKVAAKEWIESKKTLAEKSIVGYQQRVAVISNEFGNRLVCDITHKDISSYQNRRKAAGKSARTINYEVGCLRQLLKTHGLWGNLSDYVKSLREQREVGRAVSQADEKKLLNAAINNASPFIYPMLVVSLDTGVRASEIRALKHGDLRLTWTDGVLKEGYLIVPKSKTEAGKGRLIPFTQRVCNVLTVWLERFGKQPDSAYIFPKHKITCPNKPGKQNVFDVDNAKPIGEWNTAWKTVCKKAGVKYRWHDLRHTFVSRLAENPNTSEQTIREMAGHVSKEMLQRYSHIRVEAKKDAIASMEEKNGISEQKSPESHRTN